MVKVNLLPPKERTKKQDIRENIIAITLSVIAVLGIIGFYLFLTIFEKKLEGNIKTTEKEISAQQEKNNKYKDTEEKILSLNKNIERINNLQKQNPKWSQVLDEIRSKIPVDASLTEVSATTQSTSTQAKDSQTEAKASPILLTIKGLAESNFSIAKFREALGSSPYFEYVDFESASWKQEEDQFEFVLKTKLKT